MNQDNKYDAFLLDLISLLQEALIRTLSKRAVDITKFQHYFQAIFNRMTELENNFHTQSKKISKNLLKLKHFLTKEVESSKKKQYSNSEEHHNDADKPINQPIINFKSSYKPIYGSRELKSIEQEQQGQQKYINPNKRRSETANGYRQKIFENTRPMTGQMGKNRYKNKTIQMPSNPLTQEQQSFTKTIDQQYQKHHRNELYNQLQKMRDLQQKGLELMPYNLPFRKKSLSQKKWGHKIERLL